MEDTKLNCLVKENLTRNADLRFCDIRVNGVKTVDRTARWVDFKNDYKTMDIDFMESVWWVFKSFIGKRNLIYEGVKVVPYSSRVSTPLSNFEANLNYKDIQDPQ